MYNGRETVKKKILIIEDSQEIQEAASLIFDLHWPEAVVIQVLKGWEGVEKAKTESPDIILLDLGLPDIDGLRVLKEIRSFSNVPVIILTVRGEEMDKVRGLEMGADDYIVKPFAHQELLARMKTVLARRGNFRAVPENGDNGVYIQHDIIRINPETGQVTRNDQPVKLTSTEGSLVKLLAGLGGAAMPEQEILANIWGSEYSDCNEYLQVYIKRLREKIEENPAKPRIILKDAHGYSISSSAVG